MTDMQLELGFGGTRLTIPLNRRERRLHRGGWWFAQMRQLVDRAMDWSPAEEAPPEQIWLPGTRHRAEI